MSIITGKLKNILLASFAMVLAEIYLVITNRNLDVVTICGLIWFIGSLIFLEIYDLKEEVRKNDI